MAYGDIVKRFKDAPDTVLMMDTDEVKVLCTTINGREYRFNAEWLSSTDALDWMAYIFEKHMKDCHSHAVETTKIELRTSYFKFLSGFGGC